MHWLHVVQHWLAVHTGTENESSHYYAWWSGFGSCLGYLSVIGAGAAAYRHRNCHERWCLRLGKPVDGTPYLACHKHHPAHKGTKRSVGLAEIVRAYEARRR